MSQVESRGNRAEQTRQERRKKPGQTVQAGMKLHVEENLLDTQNYAYRWVNDKGTRMTQVHGLDWDPAPEVQSDEGRRIVGTDDQGKPYGAVLMRKRKDWFEEDQKEKSKRIADTTSAIARGTFRSAEDRSALENGETYTPGGANRIGAS